MSLLGTFVRRQSPRYRLEAGLDRSKTLELVLGAQLARAEMSSVPAVRHGTADVGSSIGPYRVLGIIGTGGIGIVFKAQHEITGEMVALKTVRQQREGHLASVRREFHTLRNIDHPGIVRILDGGTDSGRPWYAMELLAGVTLAQRFRGPSVRDGEASEAPTLRTESAGEPASVPARARTGVAPREPFLPLNELLTLMRKVASTLAFLHGEGIVHRDVTPSNIFITPDQKPVMMDFGLVHRYARGIREVLDLAGRREGTIGYMAPEQMSGSRIDARADLYSLGCILYEGVTGTLPFTATNVGDLLIEQAVSSVLSPRHWTPDISPGLEELILMLLARQPGDRIGHASDVARILESLGAEKDDTAEQLAPRGYLYRPQFSGRQTVVAELNVLVAQLKAGRGGMVLISGESGIGKTSLLVELARSATAQGSAVILAECQPTGGVRPHEPQTAAPLHPFVGALEVVADRCSAGGPEALARLLGDRRAVLAPYCAALAEVGASPASVSRVPDAIGRGRVFAALAATLAAMAKGRPLLLAIDDLQWSDELSLRFLESLSAEYFERTPLLIAASRRSEERGSDLAALRGRAYVRELPLGHLDRDAIAAMTGQMLAVPSPPGDLLEFLTTVSSGNPFFVAEYLRTAVHERLLVRDALGHWRQADSTDLDALPLPRSLEDLVHRRLNATSEDGRQLLDVAAVIGRESSLRLIASTLGWNDEDRLQRAASELIERQILEEISSGRLRFLHDKIREFAYAGIPIQRREALHRRAAEALEAGYREGADFDSVWPALGYHFAEARLPDRALEYLSRTADHARARYANDDAISFYQQANAQLTILMSGDPGTRWACEFARVSENLADLLTLAGRRDQARDLFQAALKNATAEANVTARLQRKLGKTWELDRQHERAASYYEQAEGALDRNPVRDESWWREWLDIQIDRIWTDYWAARLGAMERVIERVGDAADRHGSPAQRANFYQSFTLLGARKERFRLSDRTVRHARLARDAGLESADPTQIAASRFGLGFALLLHGDLEEAEDELVLALEETRRIGDQATHSRVLAYLMVLHRKRGDVEKTLALARQTGSVAAIGAMKDYEGAALANEGWAMIKRGQLLDAEQRLEHALGVWRLPPAAYPFQWLALFPLLQLHLGRGSAGACVADAKALLIGTQERLPEELERELQATAGAESNDKRALDSARAALAVAATTGYI